MGTIAERLLLQKNSGEMRNSDSTTPANRQSRRSSFLESNSKLLVEELNYSLITNLVVTTMRMATVTVAKQNLDN